jgi:hypothetical protein
LRRDKSERCVLRSFEVYHSISVKDEEDPVSPFCFAIHLVIDGMATQKLVAEALAIQ